MYCRRAELSALCYRKWLKIVNSVKASLEEVLNWCTKEPLLKISDKAEIFYVCLLCFFYVALQCLFQMGPCHV